MKHSFLALLAIISLLFACNQKDPNAMAFGESVDTTKAISATELTAKMSGNATFDGTISGKIENVCKAEGCWIKMSMGTEEPLMVRMKDHSFTVTENVEGKFAFALGQAHYDTLSVEKLRDYAKDEGAGPDEIAAISQPEFELVFEARGISVR
ncbi:MAG TPA: DUF4920 domain-containing protein [Bacteroidia bacterium]|jgi:hypothetical protein|nr:DUF4920 domain-containing protein [Bacteroidota bacterium]MBK7430069.1 DUF4920 domain-containing protein [Bacteroidota bacterium]MBK8586310.1 DUF4920 domain-containing protein [Bacteroidota bacterium]MBP9790398.1 DUF4920 domain-containing protein [Bacteroidia bacterium]HQW22809.1 DUF4920 domain-containing protein [Bacteroidia bacterium]